VSEKIRRDKVGSVPTFEKMGFSQKCEKMGFSQLVVRFLIFG
jgi:hypothetical protein